MLHRSLFVRVMACGWVTSTRLLLLSCLAWYFVSALAPAHAQSVQRPQPESVPTSGANGVWEYDFLQLLLEEQKMRVERSRNGLAEYPKKSVLIVGNDGLFTVTPQSYDLKEFVDRGGALLFMHELNGRDRARAVALLGLGTFHRGPVTALAAADAYEGYSDCVRVTDISDREGLFSGVKTLITNRADWFNPSLSNHWDWEAVATFPQSTDPTIDRPKSLLWVGRPNNNNGGIAIVISDSTLLTNNMLWHGDNSRLALRISELFKQQGRDRFCFIRNNHTLDAISQRLADALRRDQERTLPPMPKPKPTWSQMLHLGNVVAKEVADSNVLNEALQRQPRHISKERYFRALIILLIAAAIGWILWKLLTSPSLRELWVARRRQRFAYEIQSGNEAGDYRTAASYLAQEFCVQWTGSYYSRHWQQALATLFARQPSVTPEDRQELTRIVDIASRGCHERMLGADFQRFGNSIEKLRKLFVRAATA